MSLATALRKQLDEVAVEIQVLNLPMVRCTECGVVLYCGPNGVEPGDRCNAPVPAEYIAPDVVRSTCLGWLVAA